MTKCSRCSIFSDRLCRFQPPTALGRTALFQLSPSCIVTYDQDSRHLLGSVTRFVMDIFYSAIDKLHLLAQQATHAADCASSARVPMTANTVSQGRAFPRDCARVLGPQECNACQALP